MKSIYAYTMVGLAALALIACPTSVDSDSVDPNDPLAGLQPVIVGVQADQVYFSAVQFSWVSSGRSDVIESARIRNTSLPQNWQVAYTPGTPIEAEGVYEAVVRFSYAPDPSFVSLSAFTFEVRTGGVVDPGIEIDILDYFDHSDPHAVSWIVPQGIVYDYELLLEGIPVAFAETFETPYDDSVHVQGRLFMAGDYDFSITYTDDDLSETTEIDFSRDPRFPEISSNSTGGPAPVAADGVTHHYYGDTTVYWSNFPPGTAQFPSTRTATVTPINGTPGEVEVHEFTVNTNQDSVTFTSLGHYRVEVSYEQNDRQSGPATHVVRVLPQIPVPHVSIELDGTSVRIAWDEAPEHVVGITIFYTLDSEADFLSDTVELSNDTAPTQLVVDAASLAGQTVNLYATVTFIDVYDTEVQELTVDDFTLP